MPQLEPWDDPPEGLQPTLADRFTVCVAFLAGFLLGALATVFVMTVRS